MDYMWVCKEQRQIVINQVPISREHDLRPRGAMSSVQEKVILVENAKASSLHAACVYVIHKCFK